MVKGHDACDLFSNSSEKNNMPENDRANVAKCYQQVNLAKGYVGIICIINATFCKLENKHLNLPS